MFNLGNKVKSYFHRRKKGARLIWLGRWDRACNKMWNRFPRLPICEQSFSWLDRNHRRLMKLSVAKLNKLDR